MHKIQYLLSAAGICAVLGLTGCGQTASNPSASVSAETSAASSENSSSSESADAQQSTAEESGSESSTSGEEDGSSSEESSSETAEEKEEKARIKASRNQVPESADAIKDKTYSIRKDAKKGSLHSFDGKYLIEQATGCYYYFDGKKNCYYVQGGTYSFTHGTNTDGDEADMIEMQFYSQSDPVQYTIDTEDGDITLRTTVSGAQTETKIPVSLKKGTDGLKSLKKFEGIYTLYDRDYYRYEFHEDGTFYLILDQTYSVKGKKLSLRSFGKTLTYDYSVKHKKITLKSDGNTASVLIPEK